MPADTQTLLSQALQVRQAALRRDLQKCRSDLAFKLIRELVEVEHSLALTRLGTCSVVDFPQEQGLAKAYMSFYKELTRLMTVEGDNGRS